MLTHDNLVSAIYLIGNDYACPFEGKKCRTFDSCRACADSLVTEYENAIREDVTNEFRYVMSDVISLNKFLNAKHYLIYVTRYDICTNGRAIDVYEYEGDVFHAEGEIMFRSELQIYRIDHAEYSEENVKYWTSLGYEIRRWHDKY